MLQVRFWWCPLGPVSRQTRVLWKKGEGELWSSRGGNQMTTSRMGPSANARLAEIREALPVGQTAPDPFDRSDSAPASDSRTRPGRHRSPASGMSQASGTEPQSPKPDPRTLRIPHLLPGVDRRGNGRFQAAGSIGRRGGTSDDHLPFPDFISFGLSLIGKFSRTFASIFGSMYSG